MSPVPDPRIRQDFVPLRAAARPARAKRYPAGLPRVSLDDSRVGGGSPLDDLAAVLRYSLGVLPDGHGRAASSAGNRHPVDAYLHTPALPGLDAGVWYYDAPDNTLVRVADAPGADRRSLVFSAIPWRTQWRYAERGYRHVWWDAGTALTHALLIARDRGLRPVLRLDFPDKHYAELIGADLATEMPLAVVGLDGPPAPPRTPAPADPGLPEPHAEVFPLVTETHAAGSHHNTATELVEAVARSAIHELGRPLTDIITDRRTTRTYATDRPLVVEELLGLLDAVDALSWRTAAGHLVSSYVLVHGVEDLAPGLYEWSEGRLLSHQPGRYRSLGRRLCLDQAPGGDCSFLIVQVCDLPRVVRDLGQRGYRAVQLAAGIRVGAVYLAATAYGLGCTALTVCDAVLPELLGWQDRAALLACAVGVPA